MREAASKKFEQFSGRYGRKGAIAIMSALVATLPLPGSSLATLAVAEGARFVLTRLLDKAATRESLLREVEDAEGHQHDDSGKFSKTSGSKKKKAEKPAPAADHTSGETAKSLTSMSDQDLGEKLQRSFLVADMHARDALPPTPKLFAALKQRIPSLTPDEFKGALMHLNGVAKADGTPLVQLHILNEVREATPEERAVMPTRNGSAMGFVHWDPYESETVAKAMKGYFAAHGAVKEALVDGPAIREALSVPDVNAPPRIADPVEDLLAAAMAQGSALLFELTRAAVERLVAVPRERLPFVRTLFTDEERHRLTAELASVRMAGDLLGRTLLRERGQQVRKKNRLKESLDAAAGFPVVLQSTNYSCGAASFKALCEFHGLQMSEAQAARLLDTTPADGTQPDALVTIARELGFPTEVREDATVEDMAHAIAHDAPCICCVQKNGGGHWIVVYAVDLAAGTLGVMDPVDGLKTVPREQFEAGWWDTAEGRMYRRFALAVGPPAAVQESLNYGVLIEEAAGTTFQPSAALDFFRALHPMLGTDPLRLLPDMRRQAFTMAAATETELLGKVQDVLARWMAGEEGIAWYLRKTATGGEYAAPIQGKALVQKILDEAGVSPRSPAYATTVYRSNVMDAFVQGHQDELNQQIATFPVYKYSNPSDSRSRPWHAERNGLYFDSRVPFIAVRGSTMADAANCRCVPIAIDKWSWKELEAKGAMVEDPAKWVRT